LALLLSCDAFRDGGKHVLGVWNTVPMAISGGGCCRSCYFCCWQSLARIRQPAYGRCVVSHRRSRLFTMANFEHDQTIKTDQRPWVGLAEIDPIPESRGSSKVVAYHIDMLNTGKSPALKADIRFIGGPGDCSKYSSLIPRQRCNGDECNFRSIEILPGNREGSLIPRVDEAIWNPLIDRARIPSLFHHSGGL
jgi:hypothetical protein